jgi:hypothetical protein
MNSIQTVKTIPVSTHVSSQPPASNSTKERIEMKPRIKQRNSQFQTSLAGACSVLLMLCASQAGVAQQSAFAEPAAAVAAVATTPAATPPALKGPAEEKEASAPSKPGGEDIKVHGHWIIDVKNPDGSLAEHRDFQNSLADGGQLLVGLFSGYTVIGSYGIGLVGNACSPLLPEPGASNCYITQSLTEDFGGSVCGSSLVCFNTLTTAVNLTGTGSPAYSMVLSGSALAQVPGTITAVQTIYGGCYTGVNPTPNTRTADSPVACSGLVGAFSTTSGTFTGTTLATPLPVTAGQTVEVTVTISFS